GGQEPIDLNACVILAIRFELENPFHQQPSASCRLTPLRTEYGLTGSATNLPFHHDVSMDASLRRNVGGCAAAIPAFDRDDPFICGDNSVLTGSIQVLLTDDKRWR